MGNQIALVVSASGGLVGGRVLLPAAAADLKAQGAVRQGPLPVVREEQLVVPGLCPMVWADSWAGSKVNL